MSADLEDYAWRLWDYWERHLDPDLFIDRSLRGKVAGKVVLVTGGSAGIGKAAALKIAEAGARSPSSSRRDKEKLDAGARRRRERGLTSSPMPPTSPTRPMRRLIVKIADDHGGVEILINNAGRSIRRGDRTAPTTASTISSG